MEDFKAYRKGLAADLTDLRRKGIEDQNKATDFLNLAKETERYQAAKEAHSAERRLEVETGESRESHEDAAVDRAIELIKTNPAVQYLVTLNGRPYGAKDTHRRPAGFKDFYFDKAQGKLVEDTVGGKGYGVDYNQQARPGVFEFSAEPDRIHASGGGYITVGKYRVFMTFVAPVGNEFTNEHRPGLGFASALRIDDLNIIEACGDGDLSNYLTHPETDSARAFFLRLVDKMNSENIPEYWNFVKSLQTDPKI